MVTVLLSAVHVVDVIVVAAVFLAAAAAVCSSDSLEDVADATGLWSDGVNVGDRMRRADFGFFFAADAAAKALRRL